MTLPPEPNVSPSSNKNASNSQAIEAFIRNPENRRNTVGFASAIKRECNGLLHRHHYSYDGNYLSIETIA
jgi:hypothetical protein